MLDNIRIDIFYSDIDIMWCADKVEYNINIIIKVHTYIYININLW